MLCKLTEIGCFRALQTGSTRQCARIAHMTATNAHRSNDACGFVKTEPTWCEAPSDTSGIDWCDRAIASSTLYKTCVLRTSYTV